MTNVFSSVHANKVAEAPRPFTIVSVVSRALLLIVVATAVTVSLRSIGSEAAANAGSDLTNLLRFMAATKAVLALAMLAAVLWRLSEPTTSLQFAAYAVASGTMAAGPGLIWGMDHVGLGALLLHGGLITSGLLLWRDPATTSLLKQSVASKARTR